jgi:zeaxanthin glucosyltransferase
MHIGALCPSATGHVNPMATLCNELASRGHRVTVMVPPDGEMRVRSFGLECRRVAEREFPLGTLDAALEELGMLSGREAVGYTVDLFLRVAAGALRDAPRIVEEMGIEGLVVDQTSTTGRSIAENAGVPFVTLCAALLLNAEPGVPPYFTGWTYRESLLARLRNRIGNAAFQRLVRPIRRAIVDQRNEWGLPKLSLHELNRSPLAQLCQAPRAFDYPRRELPPQMHYVGPLHDLTVRPDVPFDFSRLDGRPLVYASMGSLQNKVAHVFETIARATAGLEAQVVLSFGREDASIPDDLPGSPIIVKYAPQLDLIERASVVITHAGMNTAMESLACGVPMVAIPVTNDQPAVAARIAWTGTGETLPLGKLNADRLRALVRRVLENRSYRDNAERMQGAIRAAGGVPRAADIVESALIEKKPVLATA